MENNDHCLNSIKHREILLAFATANTPRRVEAELKIKKLKIKPYIDKGLLKILNPNGRKGRLHLLTDKAKRILGLSVDKKIKNKEWDLIGQIMASPKQKLVVLRVLDSGKRTSEEIRSRAVKFNPRLSRISTKKILNELITEVLVFSEMKDRKRYYWISEKGKITLEDLESLF